MNKALENLRPIRITTMEKAEDIHALSWVTHDL